MEISPAGGGMLHKQTLIVESYASTVFTPYTRTLNAVSFIQTDSGGE